jgi:hypothetical protein
MAGGLLALTFFITFPFWFKQPVPTNYNDPRNEDLPAPVRGNARAQMQKAVTQGAQVQSGSPPKDNPIILKSVEESPKAAKTDNFPETIEVEGIKEKFRLVAWGVRTVSFLRIQVYNVGLYIPESQVDVLPTYSLSDAGGDPWPALIRMYPYPLLLRIIPVRNTDYAHLRDGFVRSTQSRLAKYADEDVRKGLVEDSVTMFKALFPKSKMKKGEVLSIVQKGPELKLYVGDHMEEDMGSVKNDDLARGLMSAYLVGDSVVSPDLKKKLSAKLTEIADTKHSDEKSLQK